MSSRQVYRLGMRDWIGLAVMLFVSSAATACQTPSTYPAVVLQAPLLDNAEWRTFEEGMEAFENEDYQKASAIFEFLIDSAHSEELYRRALYAQACARLASAQTAGELSEAMALWNCWSQQAAEKSKGEDPRLLTPLLQRLSAPEQSLSKAAKPKPRKSSYTDQVAIRDLAMYKNLLQAKEKELEKMKAKLETKDREVRRLKHQMDSIEAIHLKYQEKKKEISTPSGAISTE